LLKRAMGNSIPKIPCDFWTNLGSFGHTWRNHFFPKNKCKK
jgi:hypothetical protein